MVMGVHKSVDREANLCSVIACRCAGELEVAVSKGIKSEKNRCLENSQQVLGLT